MAINLKGIKQHKHRGFDKKEVIMISKYQKSWYCKILTILLALVIVVAVPFSSLQAYAREEGQPTETFYEKDILPDTNTKTDKLIDNNQDSVDQISSIEAEPEVITLGSSESTTWEVSDSDGLENALNNFSSGDTIKLGKHYLQQV